VSRSTAIDSLGAARAARSEAARACQEGEAGAEGGRRERGGGRAGKENQIVHVGVPSDIAHERFSHTAPIMQRASPLTAPRFPMEGIFAFRIGSAQIKHATIFVLLSSGSFRGCAVPIGRRRDEIARQSPTRTPASTDNYTNYRA
jgi:hypothetical protein